MSADKDVPKKNKINNAYLGGIASMGATIVCHPLDTIKVQLQTQSVVKHGFIGMTRNIIENSGFLSLYNGMSAALLRQATYSTVRFAFYELSKDYLIQKHNEQNLGQSRITEIPFYEKMIIAGIGGGLGSIVGSPADLVNVRMQNDSKLPIEKRRNYKNCFEAIYRIWKTEGFLRLYAGFHMATVRGVLVTIGQLAFYDEFKMSLIRTGYFTDNLNTHFTASMGAGLIATLITMPADVIKTLIMNAKPENRKSIMWYTREVLKKDKLGLFKGFWPRYIRIGPFTILTFVFYEELKLLNNRYF